jgi:hypothetical protein
MKDKPKKRHKLHSRGQQDGGQSKGAESEMDRSTKGIVKPTRRRQAQEAGREQQDAHETAKNSANQKEDDKGSGEDGYSRRENIQPASRREVSPNTPAGEEL